MNTKHKYYFPLSSLEPQIQQSMQELGKLLCKVKGVGQISLFQPNQKSFIKQLHTTVNNKCKYYFPLSSLEPQIQQSMQELGKLLCKVKGVGQISLSQPSQRSSIQQESDMVLRPLMDLLDGRYSPSHWSDK